MFLMKVGLWLFHHNKVRWHIHVHCRSTFVSTKSIWGWEWMCVLFSFDGMLKNGKILGISMDVFHLTNILKKFIYLHIHSLWYKFTREAILLNLNE